ncbi:uncharacterized protein ATC70_006663 [Mucor velutinosus]|uniref:Uncharacterized protein n=1 Tax=Mucor velutinosus TaxID=708070 RepID=A0AAN7DQ69_9FUNG|nr:hypothetical protein ATC70_006663 [Mucor velutinosus]
MNISDLNAPATPPYDYQNHATNTNNKNFQDLFFDQPSRHSSESSSEHSSHSVASDAGNNGSSETTHSAFRRVSPMSMPSPPELLIDSSEDEDNFTYSDAAMALAASLPPSYLASSQTSPSSHSSSYTMHHKRKSVPHRSPSNIVDHKSVVFQISDNCTPKILGGGNRGVLWSLRQRVSMARQSKRSTRSYNYKNRLSAPHPQRRVRPMRIQIPRPQWFRDNALYDDLVSPVNNDWQSKKSIQPIVIVPTSNLESLAPAASVNMTTTGAGATTTTWQSNTKKTHFAAERKKSAAVTNGASVATADSAATPRRKSSHHTTSGRPSRVKGPCQACNETSDGCMRKAFNWPFPTSTIFNDKGKPFVYLCNKCGLRYNKSGGCVCRNCRWVLCKEEKRKAMQLIDQMRRSRPDGRVDPEEDIENFVCTPKYWNCSRPWKVGWVLNSQHDDEDDEDTNMADQQQQSPSMSEATL